MMELGRYVLRFFKEHRETLQNHYPGLTDHRLLQEFRDLPTFGLKDSLEFFSQMYLPALTNPQTRLFDSLLQGIPLAYIFNRTYFYGHPFMVRPGIFIPRYETEILVELALAEIKKLEGAAAEGDGFLKLADLCTGSGNVLLSVLIGMGQKSEVPCQAFGIDSNPRALEVARKNAYTLGLSYSPRTELNFLPGDRFFDFKNRLHMVLCNPPYINRQKDGGDVHWAARKYDPDEALFLEDQVYSPWFGTLFDQVWEILYDGGVFLMEGHENRLEELSLQVKERGFDRVECLPDLTGRTRFLRAYKKKKSEKIKIKIKTKTKN